MTRGDIVAVREKDGPASKARPCLIVQTDRSGPTDHVTVCPLTSRIGARPLIRPTLVPTPGNGLTRVSDVEIDLMFSPKRARVGAQIGRLTDSHMRMVDDALRRWLDL